MRVRIWGRSTVEIGDYFYMGHDSQIQCDCIIGNYVMFGNRVGLVGKYDHNFQEAGSPTRLSSEIRDQDYNWKGLGVLTIIEDDVWVGFGSIIMSGVRIGRGSIIAAGSVVTKNVEPFSIYAGNPARKIKSRFESEQDLQAHLAAFKTNYPTAFTY